MELQELNGGVTAAPGFQAAGVKAGVKNWQKRDVALLVSEVPAAAAGLFTTNRVQAAPVRWTRDVVARGKVRAVAMNSGNANACNGEQGLADVRAMAETAARLLGCRPEEVAVASTGVIGVPLPLPRVLEGLRTAAAELSPAGGAAAAEAIMTTDTRPKEVAIAFTVGGRAVTLGGMAKGSGMIHPNLATMLCFLTTDLAAEPPWLQEQLRRAADDTFNLLTVDGDTSTNDTVLLLANGLAGNESPRPGSPEEEAFAAALAHVCRRLCRLMAADGEGASKLVEVVVEGAGTREDARRAARAIASSNLVKTALAGADANWGRILSAAGCSGADFDPERVSIRLASPAGGIQVAAGGRGLPFNEDEARRILAEREITIRVDLGGGRETATAYTCDLTEAYVRINADYRT